MANVSDQHITDRQPTGKFGDKLSEGGVDVEEKLDIEVIFVTTTYKCSIWVLGLKDEIVETDVLNEG